MAKRGGRGPEGYTGRLHEQDFIGGVDIQNPAYIAALRASAKPDGYIPFRAALMLAKQFQPLDPTNPQKEFSRELRLEVIDQLKLDPDAYDRVRCYTAVGTPLDVLHGVDGFIEVMDPDGRTLRRVTFDLSLRDKGGQKADLLVRDLPDPQNEQEAFLAAVAQHAGEVVASLRRAVPGPS